MMVEAAADAGDKSCSHDISSADTRALSDGRRQMGSYEQEVQGQEKKRRAVSRT